MATKKLPVKKTATKPAAKKTVAKKPVAAKAAPKKPAAKTSAAKKPVAKPATKKAIAKKIVAAKPGVKKAAPKKAAVKKPAGPYGIPEKLRDAALKILDERQAEDIVTADLRGKSAMADYAIVATGRSGRQLAAIADYLRQSCEEITGAHPRIEGLPQGDWVLIDAGDIIVHLFRPEVRTYYRIEDIWSTRSRA